MKSSRQLIQEAKDYRFNPIIPLKIYLKTCVGILDKAQLSVQQGNDEMAFLFYYRYVDLCTSKLARHPQCLSKTVLDQEVQLYKQEYLQLIKLEVPAVLRLIEDLQQKIDKEYNKHQLSLAKNIAKSNKVINNSDKRSTNHRGISPSNNENSNIQYPLLPKTFNEQRFNQSLAFFNPHKTDSSNNNSSSNSNSQRNNSPSRLNNDNINTHNNNDTNTTNNNNGSNNTAPLFHYPELPQLSFPTF